MNQRIKELLCQAYDQAVPETWTTLSSEQLEKVYDKFAALIVRECMDLLEDYTTDVHVGGIQYNVLSAEETLQKHFELE